MAKVHSHHAESWGTLCVCVRTWKYGWLFKFCVWVRRSYPNKLHSRQRLECACFGVARTVCEKQRREPLVRLGYCLLNDNAILRTLPTPPPLPSRDLEDAIKLMASLAYLYFIVQLFFFYHIFLSIFFLSSCFYRFLFSFIRTRFLIPR